MNTSLKQIAKILFAPYKLSDSYGSVDYYFSLANAISDLPNCSPVAVIGSRITKRVLLQRIQQKFSEARFITLALPNSNLNSN